MTTIHLGDHDTDCETCKLNCSCHTCEQTNRINENVEDFYLNPAEYSFEDFESMFEDRDPIEFI